MKARYRLTRRGSRGDTFYCVDSKTRTRVSLRTSDKDAVQQIVNAKNQAEQPPESRVVFAKHTHVPALRDALNYSGFHVDTGGPADMRAAVKCGFAKELPDDERERSEFIQARLAAQVASARRNH